MNGSAQKGQQIINGAAESCHIKAGDRRGRGWGVSTETNELLGIVTVSYAVLELYCTKMHSELRSFFTKGQTGEE